MQSVLLSGATGGKKRRSKSKAGKWQRSRRGARKRTRMIREARRAAAVRFFELQQSQVGHNMPASCLVRLRTSDYALPRACILLCPYAHFLHHLGYQLGCSRAKYALNPLHLQPGLSTWLPKSLADLRPFWYDDMFPTYWAGKVVGKGGGLPMLLCHGKADSFVPFELGRRSYKRAQVGQPGRCKCLLSIPIVTCG